jgi:hypothetical protein
MHCSTNSLLLSSAYNRLQGSGMNSRPYLLYYVSGSILETPLIPLVRGKPVFFLLIKGDIGGHNISFLLELMKTPLIPLVRGRPIFVLSIRNKQGHKTCFLADLMKSP